MREFEEIKHVNLNWQYGIEKNGNFLKDGSQMKSMMMDRTGWKNVANEHFFVAYC